MIADLSKIKAMVEWFTLKTIKGLHGFLGLTGYYCKLVKDYGKIRAPLITLLRKYAFKWGLEVKATFGMLKKIMSTTLVLALLDFNKIFVLECDGGVLMQ